MGEALRRLEFDGFSFAKSPSMLKEAYKPYP